MTGGFQIAELHILAAGCYRKDGAMATLEQAIRLATSASHDIKIMQMSYCNRFAWLPAAIC